MRIDPRRRFAVPLVAVAFSLLASVPALGQTPQAAQVLNRFAGNWIEDQSQRKTDAERNLTFRKGANGLEEVRGSYSRPLVESVRFGSGPYDFGEPNVTMEWKQQGDGHFERTMVENGKTLETREISISPDGKTLTEITQRSRPDGKKSTETIVYVRSSGSGQNLEGVWKPQTVHSDTPNQMSIEAVGGTLKVETGSGIKYDLRFDGKAAPLTGPNLISGTTLTGRILSNDEIQTSSARLGTPTGKSTWKLSNEGKTLTQTMLPLGPNESKKPSVYVYMKQ
ncbi:MAG TPA: hypothetical protein VMB49_18325 [Acidobacteriaceae bacterium]|nr:hypothetical protein [Acidobacteriaceae bacterium]